MTVGVGGVGGSTSSSPPQENKKQASRLIKNKLLSFSDLNTEFIQTKIQQIYNQNKGLFISPL
jgi:hypothetical protein